MTTFLNRDSRGNASHSTSSTSTSASASTNALPQRSSRPWSRWILSWAMLCSTLAPTFAATYYIDFQNGNNTRAGTSPSTAWKHIPGTQTLDSLDYVQAAFGGNTVSPSVKVPAGTIFKLKSGTTYNGTLGGVIKIDRTYYEQTATLANPIRFERDTNWGSGPVTFDGTGVPKPSVILIQTDGVVMDGAGTNGIKFINALGAGLHVKEKPGSGDIITGTSFSYLYFKNNGYSYKSDYEGAGDGQLNLRKVQDCYVSNVELDGNNQYINGVLIGDDHKPCKNVVIQKSISYNHRGDISGNDAGIGFKALNSIVTFSNLVTSGNLKGFDLGENHGDNNNIDYRVISCEIRSNYWGANFNCYGNATYTGAVKYYIINSVLIGNQYRGISVYAGPFEFYAINNVFVGNGFTGGQDACHLRVTPDTISDNSRMVARIYNNYFTGGTYTVYNTSYFDPAVTQLTFFTDYNCYNESTSVSLCKWAYFQSSQSKDFKFGANGAGNSTGEWYTTYSKTTTPPTTAGMGHFGSDSHSVGTGTSTPSVPSLVSIANGNFRLSSRVAGANISNQSWFIEPMRYDRAGVQRTTWDIGAYESSSAVPPAIVSGVTASKP